MGISFNFYNEKYPNGMDMSRKYYGYGMTSPAAILGEVVTSGLRGIPKLF